MSDCAIPQIRDMIEALSEHHACFRALDATVLAIVGGDPDRARAHHSEMGPPFPFLMDPDDHPTRWCLGDETSTPDEALKHVRFVAMHCTERGVADLPTP